MKFLLKYNFTEEEIRTFSDDIPPLLLEHIFNSYQLVSKNMDTLKEMGIQNYKPIFLKYYDMFLMDNSNFIAIFNRYERADLVEKIEKNFEVIEFL